MKKTFKVSGKVTKAQTDRLEGLSLPYSLTIEGNSSDFDNPEGKTFVASARLYLERADNEIVRLLFSNLNLAPFFENETIVIQNGKFSDDFESEHLEGSFSGTLVPGWSSLKNVTFESKPKNVALKTLLGKFEVEGDGVLKDSSPVDGPAPPSPPSPPSPPGPGPVPPTPEPPGPIDPDPIDPEEPPFFGFVWKPKSQSQFHLDKLVVLLPDQLRRQIATVGIYNAFPIDGQTSVEMGVFANDTANGGRPHYRFSKIGGDYNNGIYLIVKMLNGVEFGYLIPVTELRTENVVPSSYDPNGEPEPIPPEPIPPEPIPPEPIPPEPIPPEPIPPEPGPGPNDRVSKQWEMIEWEFFNTDHGSNPFDVVATAEFKHESGETISTEIFYDGGNSWDLRFTGTKAGEWNFKSSSSSSQLNGIEGQVIVTPNPNGLGFLTAHGNKFATQVGDGIVAHRFNAYMDQTEFQAKDIKQYKDLSKVQGYIENARANGMDRIFLSINHNWFKLGAFRWTDHNSRNPDPETFYILERFIGFAHSQGIHTHLWAWGDKSRKTTPDGIGGINGDADRRLQRYICARLGPIPGWTMGYGFDLQEWASESQLGSWAKYMHDHMGWRHLLWGRGRSNPELDVKSYSEYNVRSYDQIVNDLNKDSNRPHLYEERHSYQRNSSLSMDGTRRFLWDQTMAGGMGGFWGFYEPQSSAFKGHPYPNPEQLRTAYSFFTGRFSLDMQRANLSDGRCLKGNKSYICYKESTDSIFIDLSGESSGLKAFLVDTKKDYKEIDLGVLAAKRQSIPLPYKSDWALYAGESTIPEPGPGPGPIPPPGGGTGGLRKTYDLDATVDEMDGLMAGKFKDARIKADLVIEGAKENFDNPAGKTFLLSGQVISLKDENGDDLDSELDPSDMKFENEPFVLNGFNFSGKITHPNAIVEYSGSISTDWATISNILIATDVQGSYQFLADNVKISGAGRIRSSEEIDPPTGPPSLPPVDPTKDHKASFLLDGAGTRVMNYLSHAHTSGWRDPIRKRLLDNGDTIIYLYLSNHKDGPEVSPYVDQDFGGTFDENRIQEWHRLIQQLIGEGLHPVFWLFADDSSKISNAPIDHQKSFITRMVQEFQRYAVHFVIALEANEHMDKSRVSQLVSHLNSQTTTPIGLHLTTGQWKWAKEIPEVDYLYYQYGWGKSPSQLKSETESRIRDMNPKGVVGAEYNKSSNDKGQGQAILDGGAIGYGNGKSDPRSSGDGGGDDGLPFSLSEVHWLHTDVSGWPITSNLKSVRVSGSSITLDHNKASVWKTTNFQGTDVAANPWIFVKQDGKWYAATWEWMRPGQTTKSKSSVSGGHIKKSPLNNFSPKSGEEYGFMVSGLARTGLRNNKERSNIVMYRWP